LILGKRMGAEELERVGFINKIFTSATSETLLSEVVSHLRGRLYLSYPRKDVHPDGLL
jgi:hypothetical protein